MTFYDATSFFAMCGGTVVWNLLTAIPIILLIAERNIYKYAYMVVQTLKRNGIKVIFFS